MDDKIEKLIKHIRKKIATPNTNTARIDSIERKLFIFIMAGLVNQIFLRFTSEI